MTMKTRDEYVSKLKAQLDRWNAEAAKWEAQAKATEAKQLQAFRSRRDEALYNLKLVESASASAWQELAKGADVAWDRMQDAFAKARTHFEKAPGPKPRA
jgi:hypothetical protein